ncbi:hypothetical protein NHX12_031259 [Muraenolepis orangiensis]|uniref:Uncharacterized protein n=1 Tax=Muraenolepis orangiensis TaxID=630683 RepID=A0A9Q0E744_9TELE|nr:hypothetical protein NHX12_031259 [Muraenolepis orangiensis]
MESKASVRSHQSNGAKSVTQAYWVLSPDPSLRLHEHRTSMLMVRERVLPPEDLHVSAGGGPGPVLVDQESSDPRFSNGEPQNM